MANDPSPTWWFQRMGTRWVIAEILLLLYSFRLMENRFAKHCNGSLSIWGYTYTTDSYATAGWDMVMWWAFQGYRTIRALQLYSNKVHTPSLRSRLRMFYDEPSHMYLKMRIFILIVTTAQYVLIIMPNAMGGCSYMPACIRGSLMLILYYTEFSTRATHEHEN